MVKYFVRKATVDDIVDLVRLRRLMFQSMNFTDEKMLSDCDKANKEYFQRAIPNEIYYGWIAENEEKKIVGCGGLVLDTHPPGPTNLTGQIGYIMNMSVESAYRRQGIAKEIFKHILLYLKELGVKTASLHPTDLGQPLYELFGFSNANEMRLKLSTISESAIQLK